MNIQIPVDKIRVVIWKWGENVQRMEKDYGVKISIDDDGNTTITALTQEGWDKVKADISQLLWEPEVGYKDKWKIIKIIDGMWAIVEFRGKSWMIHISKLSYKRIENIQDVVKEWDIVEFEIIQVDLEKGRIWLKRELTEVEQKEFGEIKAKKDAEIKERQEKLEKTKNEEK
jgi:polyribonucleotide nucleotidyltransferase